MELSDIKESAEVLSKAMLKNPIHMAVFKGSGENERLEIEKMFFELLHNFPGIVFIAKKCNKIVGVMRMKSCKGQKKFNKTNEHEDENDISYRKLEWLREWSIKDPADQHWHLGPIGVLPSYRRLGVGSRFMELFCMEVDKCFAKAYLETDLDENVLFYKKFGFELDSESSIFGVKNRYMVRTVQI